MAVSPLPLSTHATSSPGQVRETQIQDHQGWPSGPGQLERAPRRLGLQYDLTLPLEVVADQPAQRGLVVHHQDRGTHARKRNSRTLLLTTEMLEIPIAAAAITGFSSPSAASGKAARL